MTNFRVINDPTEREIAVLDAINAVEEAFLPTAPQNVVATPGNLSVGLTWDALSIAPPVTNYRVLVGLAEDGPYDLPPVDAGTNTSATVTGLLNGTEYFFVVEAANAFSGYGPLSAEHNATPSGG